MSRNRLKPDGLTPEESRFLDGELTPQEMRSMEHRLRADPERSAQLEAWREAMDLWRDDAARSASFLAGNSDAEVEGNEFASVDVGADGFQADDFAEDLVERILSEGPPPSPDQLRLSMAGRRLVTPTVARWYATAAAVLIAIGVSGTILTQPRAVARSAASPESDMADVEQLFVDLVAQGPEFEPPLSIPHSKEGR